MRTWPWIVTDTNVVSGERCPVMGVFATEDEAAEFIETLPDYESGRYSLDDRRVSE